MVESSLGQGRAARVIQHRYKQSRMHVRNKRGAGVVVRPGSGGLQDDVCMPDQFAVFYDEKVENWIDWRIRNRDGVVLAREPGTGRLVEVGTTLYADDINEKNMTKDAAEFERITKDSRDRLDGILSECGMCQDMGKADHVCCFGGMGQTKQTKIASQDGEASRGKVRYQAKYLGNVCMFNGKASENTKNKVGITGKFPSMEVVLY